MIVKIVDSAAGLTADVAEPNVFKGLHVEVPASVPSDALSRLLVVHGIGHLVGSDGAPGGGEAVALSIEWLRSHVDDHAGFDAMVAYADSKGWALPGDAVRAHVVRS